MRPLRLALVLALGAALGPEVARYRAERSLYRVSSAVLLAARDPGRVPGGARTLLRFGAEARAAAEALPGDPRPLQAATSLELMAGRPAEARELALRALSDGERPELLLAVWRADRALGRDEEGRAALRRAARLAPGLVALVSDSEAAEALARVRAEEADPTGPVSPRSETLFLLGGEARR
ncbi:MAG: hypothetical protein ACYDBY_07185 [Thermoanaerobaculia bacterium]